MWIGRGNCGPDGNCDPKLNFKRAIFVQKYMVLESWTSYSHSLLLKQFVACELAAVRIRVSTSRGSQNTTCTLKLLQKIGSTKKSLE